MTSLVAGAGGMIGGHMVKDLVDWGEHVVAVDIKPLSQWFQVPPSGVEIIPDLDLSFERNCFDVTRSVDNVYMFAADMGGMGFIENNKLDCMLSVLISTNMIVAASESDVESYVYASSACVYAADKQVDELSLELKESDAYPAEPEDGYGWEKLFSERMCQHFWAERGLPVTIPRFHNVYGPFSTYEGGREKAPAAICRKVAEAKLSGSREIDIWGDGEQTRSFMFVDDCVTGVNKLVASGFRDPINLGSAERVSINQLVTMVEAIAGVSLHRNYVLDAPQGVRGRSSDNSLIRSVTGWEPSISLVDGLEKTFSWVYDQMKGV